MESRERLKGSECITPEEIQLISGQDYEASLKEHEQIRQSLGFHSDELLVEQYCDYHDLDLEEIIDFLNAERSVDELIIEEEEQDLAFDEMSLAEAKEMDKAYAEYLEAKSKFIPFDETKHTPQNNK